MFKKKEAICCVLFCSISFSPSICSFSPSSNEDFSAPQHVTVQSQSFKFKASCQHFQVCVCVCKNIANKFTERGHFLKASVPRKYWQSATSARRDAASSAKELSLSLSLCGALRCMLTQCQLLISQQTTTFSVYPHRNKAGLRQSLHCVYTSRLKQSRLAAKQQHRRGDAKWIPSVASFMSLFDALLTCLGVNLNICCMWIALLRWWFRYRVFA